MQDNVFKLPHELWQISLCTQYKDVEILGELFSAISSTISYSEKETSTTIDAQPEDIWHLNVILYDAPNMEHLQSILNLAKNDLGIICTDLKITKIDNRDWIRESQINFKPIKAGSFYIHSSFYNQDLDPANINIQIDPGRAFGTGDHETTSGCLELLCSDELAGLKDGNYLDMGTGSGILGIAMVKRYGGKVVATDIDDEATIIASENSMINGCLEQMMIFPADGYNERVKKTGPYDIICSNILAGPLVAMAADLKSCLKPGGYGILAGFLINQEDAVIKAHEEQGLIVKKRLHKNGWSNVMIQFNSY